MVSKVFGYKYYTTHIKDIMDMTDEYGIKVTGYNKSPLYLDVQRIMN